MEKEPIQYETPGVIPKREAGDLGGAPQQVFDTVAGPNLRLRDNLIQLGCCVGGALVGAGIGWMVARRDPMLGLIGGGFIGLLAGLVGSGVVIGVYRFARSVKK